MKLGCRLVAKTALFAPAMPYLCRHSDHHVILRVCVILAVLCVSHLPCVRCGLSLLPWTSCIRSIMGLACSWTVCLCCIYVEAGFACGCYVREPFARGFTYPVGMRPLFSSLRCVWLSVRGEVCFWKTQHTNMYTMMSDNACEAKYSVVCSL